MMHELDPTTGEPVHVDVDPFIPTGRCAICIGKPQETDAPEDRPQSAEDESGWPDSDNVPLTADAAESPL